MKHTLVALIGLTVFAPAVVAQQKPKPAPTPAPKHVRRAQQARSQSSRQTKARAKAKPSPTSAHPPLVVAARPPTPAPKPAPAKVAKLTGVITAVDLEKNTVTVQCENVATTFTFLPTVSLNFYSGESRGLTGLTKGTTVDVTSADNKRATVIVVHDTP